VRALDGSRVRRVAVDGVDGAGKTVFADELARELTAGGTTVVRASVDGFHHPREVRYRRGRTSPDGFYLDSYDYATLRAQLLDPLGPGGSGWFRTAAWDWRSDSPVDPPEQHADPGDVLVLDGIFLHRPEVPFDVSYARMSERDGTPSDPQHDANRRYLDGQRRYLAECDPAAHASIVVDNSDLLKPVIVERGTVST
jgi:uridine kinase